MSDTLQPAYWRIVGFELHRVEPNRTNGLKRVRYEGHALYRQRGWRGLFAKRIRVLLVASNDETFVKLRLRQRARVHSLPQTYRTVHR